MLKTRDERAFCVLVDFAAENAAGERDVNMVYTRRVGV